MSDLVNFNLGFEAPHPSVETPLESSVAESFQNTGIEDTHAGCVDAIDPEFAAIFQLPDGSSAMGDGFNATKAPSENKGNLNTVQAPSTALSIDYFPLELGPWDLDIADAFEKPTQGNAAIDDFDMTDVFQTTLETDAPLNDFTVFEPTPFTHGFDPAALEMPRSPPTWVSQPIQGNWFPQSNATPQFMREPSRWVPCGPRTRREPSRWVPVSPGLQRRLNLKYAPQISRHRASRSPAPVLYFPAEHHIGYSLPSNSFSPGNFRQVSQPRAKFSAIGRSFLMQGSAGLHRHQPTSNGMYHPSSTTSDGKKAKAEDAAPFPVKKRVLEANDFDSEPTPKRRRTDQAGSSPPIAKGENTGGDNNDDNDKPMTQQTMNAQQNSLLTLAKDDTFVGEPSVDSEDDTDHGNHDEQSSSPPSSPASPMPTPTPSAQEKSSNPPPSMPVLENSPKWRYEQQHESRLRDQRKNEWIRRRATGSGAISDRKMQKLLAEIEDTEGFVEAQGYRDGECVESESMPRRPVRKGARKSYVGQE